MSEIAEIIVDENGRPIPYDGTVLTEPPPPAEERRGPGAVAKTIFVLGGLGLAAALIYNVARDA